jgi:hypothetical protein
MRMEAIEWDTRKMNGGRGKFALDTAYVVPSPVNLLTLMMDAILSSETSILTRATRRHIPEDGIF